MNSMADDVAHWLAGRGSLGALGGAADWCLNYAVEPAEPGNCVTVYDTGGLEPDTDELDIFRPTFQVRVRCATYRDGYAKQREIMTLLTAQNGFSMATSVVVGIAATSDVQSIGRDDKSRHLLVANYLATRTAI